MKIEELENRLRNVPTEYRSIPFWSWNNCLDKAELVKQIEEMHSKNIGGFIMHARTGLKDEYLGEKWFECIDVCLKKAKELGMEAWVYDENGWPSGFVGGKLLENVDYRAQYLEYKVLDHFDKDAFAVYEQKDDSFSLVDSTKDGMKEYHTVYLMTSPSNSDILNPEVTDAFIRETHEKYYARFKESFGRELKGFFTDEPQYYRWGTPYTKVCKAEFDKKGENIKEGLIYLFKKNMPAGYAFRTEYFNTMNMLYVTNFYKKLYDWCTEHNCMLTGHSVEETRLFTQMWGGADCAASYEFEHIPGVDYLGKRITDEFPYRQLGSVASQLGKKFVLTENFACGGHDTTPTNLKCIGEIQYFNGINKMCQHLYPFSIAAQGRIDHPPVFSKHSNWFDEFGKFNDHFNRLSYIIANTKNVCDVAIINPMRSVYLDYVRSEDFESVKTLEIRFLDLLDVLRKNGVMYDLVDERILSRHGSIENGALRVGECVYKSLIVPYMPSIAGTTYELLKNYKEKIHVIETPEYIDGNKAKVELVSNNSMQDILDARTVKLETEKGIISVTKRKSDLGEFIFIINANDKGKSENGEEGSSKFRIKGISEEYKIFDIDTLTTIDMSDEVELKKFKSIILIKDENAKEAALRKSEDYILTNKFQIESISDNYLVLDYISISKDGKNYSKKESLQLLFENLLREDYKGELYVKYDFDVKSLSSVKLIMEFSNYEWVKMNGEEVRLEQSDFDIYYREADVTDYLKVGNNEIEYKINFFEHDGVHFALFDPLATESVRNCLYYDTSIENIYLKGDFVVDQNMVISKRTELPKSLNNLEKQGYPFFRGQVSIAGKIQKDSDEECVLELSGKYIVASVKTKKGTADYLYDDEMDITNVLENGLNDTEIVLRSSNRNLYGPHHDITKEPEAVSPYSFTYRGNWNGKKAPEYVDEYNSVPFGLNDIILKKIRK